MNKSLQSLLVATLIFAGSTAYTQSPHDRLKAFDNYTLEKKFKYYRWGEEKFDNTNIDHALFCAIGNMGLTGLYNKWEIEHAKEWAAFTTFLFGVGKETVDGYRKNDKFSWNDLMGDCVGITVTLPFLSNKKQIEEKTARRKEKEMLYEFMRELEKRDMLNEKYERYLREEDEHLAKKNSDKRSK